LPSTPPKSKKNLFNAAEFGFEFSEEYLAARWEVFYADRKTVLLDFDRAWRAKMRAKAA